MLYRDFSHDREPCPVYFLLNIKKLVTRKKIYEQTLIPNTVMEFG